MKSPDRALSNGAVYLIAQETSWGYYSVVKFDAFAWPLIGHRQNFGPQILLGINNGIAPPRSFLGNQKTAPLERAQSGLFTAIFISFGTALVIDKIKFENFSHIPTW